MKSKHWTYQSILQIIEVRYGSFVEVLKFLTRDNEDANEVLQAAILQVIEDISSKRIKVPRSIAVYVYSASIHLLHERRRGLTFIRKSAAGEGTAKDVPPPVAEGESRYFETETECGLNTILSTVVGSLPTQRDRDILSRFYVDEEEKESICNDLVLSSRHFDEIIFRARQRLSEEFEQQGMQFRDLLHVTKSLASTNEDAAAARDKIRQHARQIVIESGNREAFDVDAWLEEWLQQPIPALDGKRPNELLKTVAGQQMVMHLLMCAQSGSYM
jgi:RNA polymerase sigma-70 factor, ECF subfamily